MKPRSLYPQIMATVCLLSCEHIGQEKKKIRQKKYETVPRLTSELEVKCDYFS